MRVLRNESGSLASPAQPPGSLTRYPRYRPEIQKFWQVAPRRTDLGPRSIRGRIAFSYTSAIPIPSAGVVLSTRAVDPDGRLVELLDQLKDSKLCPDPIVFNGDLADKGGSEAHHTLRAVVEPLAAQLNAQLVWMMGNHDNRVALRRFLLGEAPSMAPLDRVRVIDGLRIITVDTSVPGFHHGDVGTSQMDWFPEELATPIVAASGQTRR